MPQPAFKKQPRCTQCRKDHKVVRLELFLPCPKINANFVQCLPYERQPGQSCTRCSEKNLQCMATSNLSGSSSRPDNLSNRISLPDFAALSSAADTSYHNYPMSIASPGEGPSGLSRRMSYGGTSPSYVGYMSPTYPGSPSGSSSSYPPYTGGESASSSSRRGSYRQNPPLAPRPTYPYSSHNRPIAPHPGYSSQPPTPPTPPGSQSANSSSDRIQEIMSIANLLDEDEEAEQSEPPKRYRERYHK